MALPIYPIKPVNPIAKPTYACVPVTDVLIISSPGHYCVQNDIISADGRGIEIRADNVTLDLGGHALSTNSSDIDKTVGIYSSSGQDITVTNGTIMGFQIGISLGQNPYVVANARPTTGNYTVTGMTINNTHSCNYYCGAMAINIYATVATISNNNIHGVSGSYAVGIQVYNYVGANYVATDGKLIVQNNWITGIKSSGPAAQAFGIQAINYLEQLAPSAPNFELRINGNAINDMQSTGTAMGIVANVGLANNGNLDIVDSTVNIPGIIDIGTNNITNFIARLPAGIWLYFHIDQPSAAQKDLSFHVRSAVVHDSQVLLTIGEQRIGIFTPYNDPTVQIQNNLIRGATDPYFGAATGSNNYSD